MTQDAEMTAQATIEEQAAAEEREETSAEEVEERETLQAELAEARGALEQERALRAQVEADLAAAVEGCRKALLAGAPELPAELVQGGTVADLEAAFANAKALAERVRQQVASEAAQERVPAGAPPRRGVDASALSSQQKILLGLRQLQQE